MPHLRTATKSPIPQAPDCHVAGAGPHSIALTPPVYGLDIVDRAATGEGPLQLRPAPVHAPVQRQVPATPPNRTGLPDTLKTGIESLSGYDLSDVRVHYNSSQPAQLQALAYTQGTDIHVAPGQIKHLPHEAWHVVQQKQGRVQPTLQLKGEQVNDDQALEREAEVMGMQALSMRRSAQNAAAPTAHVTTVQRAGASRVAMATQKRLKRLSDTSPSAAVIQRRVGFEFETGAFIYRTYQAQKTGQQAQKTGQQAQKTGRDHKVLVADERDIFEGKDWKLVSDTGRMEFVSEPFNRLEDSSSIIKDIATFITHSTVSLNTDIRKKNSGKWLHEAVGEDSLPVTVSKDAENAEKVDAQTFYGKPQVSVGCRLESLGDFLSQLRTDTTLQSLSDKLAADREAGAKHPLHPNVTEQAIGHAAKLLDESNIKATVYVAQKSERLIAQYADQLQKSEQDKLRGIWSLITQYWINLSGHKSGYIKGDLPVMARTDFHSMYKALGKDAKEAFAAAKNYFIARNVPQNVNQGTTPLIQGQKFTMADWYDSIIQPDRFGPVPQHTGLDKKIRVVDLVSDESRVAQGTNKSMGQMPMDTTDPNVPRTVFELRHVGGAVKIHISDLEPHVLKPIFTLLRRVNA